MRAPAATDNRAARSLIGRAHKKHAHVRACVRACLLYRSLVSDWATGSAHSHVALAHSFVPIHTRAFRVHVRSLATVRRARNEKKKMLTHARAQHEKPICPQFLGVNHCARASHRAPR